SVSLFNKYDILVSNVLTSIFFNLKLLLEKDSKYEYSLVKDN
ncbi:7383_t:CDS:1, partial [Dentiscutata erythropus]